MALRSGLDALSTTSGKTYLVSRTPLDLALSPVLGTNGAMDYYYDVFADAAVRAATDYIMPQYYNGYNYVPTDATSALAHYADMVDLFDGDSNRVVFGYCLEDCVDGFAVTASRAVEVTTELYATFPNHGGIFLSVYDARIIANNGDWVHGSTGNFSLEKLARKSHLF